MCSQLPNCVCDAEDPRPSRIVELESALKHAQEALFWHHGEDFEMDGRRIGDRMREVLHQSPQEIER